MQLKDPSFCLQNAAREVGAASDLQGHQRPGCAQAAARVLVQGRNLRVFRVAQQEQRALRAVSAAAAASADVLRPHRAAARARRLQHQLRLEGVLHAARPAAAASGAASAGAAPRLRDAGGRGSAQLAHPLSVPAADALPPRFATRLGHRTRSAPSQAQGGPQHPRRPRTPAAQTGSVHRRHHAAGQGARHVSETSRLLHFRLPRPLLRHRKATARGQSGQTSRVWLLPREVRRTQALVQGQTSAQHFEGGAQFASAARAQRLLRRTGGQRRQRGAPPTRRPPAFGEAPIFLRVVARPGDF